MRTHLFMSEVACYLFGPVVGVQVDVVVGVCISATPSDNVYTGEDGGYKGTLHDSVHDTCCCGESYTQGDCVG